MEAPRGFEDWLRERPLPRPRAAFRERLRARFLGPPARTSDSGSRVSAQQRSEEVPDLEAFLRQRSPPPLPRESFRAELRARFVATPRRDGAARPAAAGPEQARPRPKLLPALVGLAGLAAAALVLAVILPRLGQPAPHWRVVGAESATRVAIAAGGAPRSAAPDGTLDLSDLLLHPGEIEVTGGSLRLAYEDEFRLEVLPGTRLVLASDGGRALGLPQGEIFLQTFPGYPGSGLEVDTPQAHVAVQGTTLGARTDAMGTCVCVVEGQVELRELARGEDVTVPQASSHLVSADPTMMSKRMPFPDGQAAPGDAEHEHVDRLREFAETDWR